MNVSVRLCVLVLPVVLLAACASPAPTQYYTLESPLQNAAPRVAAGFAVDVLPVAVPRQVDTQSLVLREGESRLQVQDAHLWAAPLADEIRQALSQDLTRILGTIDVHGLPSAGREPVYRVRVVVTRFDSVYGGHAAVDALWSLRGTAPDSTPLTCHSREVRRVAPGYAALVRGHQQALAALAAQIAAALRAMPDARCLGDAGG